MDLRSVETWNLTVRIIICDDHLIELICTDQVCKGLPQVCLCFNIAVGLAWSNDPESYAGGSVATGRVSRDRQVKGDDPDKKGYPGPPGWGLGRGADSLVPYKSIVSQTHDKTRIKERKYNMATSMEKTNGT